VESYFEMRLETLQVILLLKIDMTTIYEFKTNRQKSVNFIKNKVL